MQYFRPKMEKTKCFHVPLFNSEHKPIVSALLATSPDRGFFLIPYSLHQLWAKTHCLLAQLSGHGNLQLPYPGEKNHFLTSDKTHLFLLNAASKTHYFYAAALGSHIHGLFVFTCLHLFILSSQCYTYTCQGEIWLIWPVNFVVVWDTFHMPSIVFEIYIILRWPDARLDCRVRGSFKFCLLCWINLKMFFV